MKKQWNDYVRELMVKKNLNQNDLAEIMDKTQGAIGHWLTGRRTPNFDDVAKILKFLGSEKVVLNPDGTIEDFESNAKFVQVKKSFHYPLLSPVQAGYFTEVNLLNNADEITQYEMISSQIKAGRNAFYLKIVGNSMSPRFQEGDMVLIDPGIYPSPGDFVVAINEDNEATFKQYKETGEVDEHGRKHFKLVPLNDNFGTLSSKHHKIKIIGKAVEHRSCL